MAPATMHSPAAAPLHGIAATAGDSAVVRQIEKTHFPNGEAIDAMSILHIAKDILDECNNNNIPPTQNSEEEGGDNTKLTPELQFEVNRLSIQLSHRSLEVGDDVHKKSITLLNMLSSYSWEVKLSHRSLEGGDDVHKKSITLLNMLSSYSWEVKVALILAAYVSNYGEYWLLAKTYRDQDPVAMNMVALLQMSDLLKDDNNKLETLFKPLENLVNSILDLCGCIVEVKEFLSSGYASSNPAEFARIRAIIIISSYWIIRCCVICTSYMHSLIVKDPSRTTSMDEVLQTLAGKIEPLHNHLQKQLLIFYQKLDARDKIEALGRILSTNHIDNMNVLKLLFDAMDHKPTPIFDVSNKKHVSLGTFKNKTVLLFVSSTDISQPEQTFFQEWYEKCNEVQRSQHDIIFFPITESPVDTKNKTFTMPFYKVDDPRSIDPTVIRYVKEKLNFQEEPILVALGTHGTLVHPNAMPMIWTWGPKAFPLTTEKEESLRKSETWKLEVLINDLDDTLIKMAREGKSICLYGGDNLEWIQMLAAKAKEVSNSLSVPLEMFFLGKSTDNLAKLKKIMSNIYSEKLVSTIPDFDSTKVRSFWAHLESMLLSRAQYLKRTKQNNDEDRMLQGLEKVLDKSGRRGWALFSKGNDIALIGDEDVTMKALNEIDKWKGNVKQNGFEGALKDYYEMLQGGASDRPCCRLHFQDRRSDEILESITCPECHRRLNKYTAFLCNHITEGDSKKLVFFEGGGYNFDMEDLLRASTEVLGKGSVGTSYKATLEEGTTVVVKRLRDVVVNRKEFEQQMEVLGKLKNENVFPLRAFYFSEDEKMLVFDYMPAGSLSTLLHGSRRRYPIGWDTRMEIALCAAKGLAYLHERGNIVHGNIKASNILLKQDNHEAACLSDYGLNPLFSNSTPLNHGYCAPEVVLETRKVTFKSDVYSYGVLLLELITRKSPNQASLGDYDNEGIDLPRWVQSVVREEGTSKVFDVELTRNHNVVEDLVQVLQIGMSCVAMVPHHRPTMAEVFRMLEDISLLL